MPGVYDSVSSLPSLDSDYTDSSPLHPKEIIIRIYASDEQGRFFATAPVPPPTPPDTTGSSGSDQEREQEKQKKATPPLRRKLSKAARLRSKEESPKASTGSVSRSFSNPIKRLNYSKSAESFRQACEAAKQTPHRASQPPQQLQRQDSRVQTSTRRKAIVPYGIGQGTEYDQNVFSQSGTSASASASGAGSSSGPTDVPVFGSCDKRVRRNRSYESNMTPPSKRGRSKTLDRYAVDHSQSSLHPVIDEAPPPPVPAKDMYNQVYDQTFGQDHSYGYAYGHGVPAEPLPNLSLEQFRKEIGWPSAVDVNDTTAAAAATTTTTTTNAEELLPATRYSGISPIPTTESSSIDDPLQPENWGLRHPERQSSLMGWEFGSPHRLLHKAGRISEEDRQSIAANFDSFADQTSEGPKRRVDVVPVVVIPQRQSSLCYPATQAAVPPRNNIPSRPQESDRRPSTAAGDWARSSGQTPQQTEFPHRIASRSQSTRRPVVPPRRSSLSAPTSADNSRATSLTSDSLRSHTILMREDEFKRHLADKPIPNIPSEPLRPSMFGLTDDDTQTQSILIGIEDIDRIGAASVPLSHLSHDSSPSSPGVVEVNQATAVNLYPHNNESLLVVDRQHNPYQNPNSTFNQNQNLHLNPLNQNPLHPNRKPINSKKAPAPSSSKTRSPRVEFATAYEGESPKHPQPPPNTPICHVTPPSSNPPPTNKAHEPMLSRFGSLRRAWSTRSRTQPTRTQPTSVPKRSFSTSATENRKDATTSTRGAAAAATTTTSKPPESRLHPFWRPRREKLDTQPDKSSSSSPMHPPTFNTKQNDNIVKNSLGMPQPRAVMDGPSLPARTRSRRETNQRQRPQPPPSTNVKRKPLPLSNDAPNRTAVVHSHTHTRSNSSRTINESTPDFIYRASRASRQLNLRQCQGHHHPVTWGYRVRFGTVKNLRRRFRGRIQRQKESEQREKLRRNIGGMAQVDAVRERGYPSPVATGAAVTGAPAGVGGRRRRERLTKRR